jgi:hypothetical protein
LAANGLFGFGIWIYQWLLWADHPIFFSLGSALLICFAAFLFFVGRRLEDWRIVLAGLACFCYWLLSILPLIQKIGWSGSAKAALSVRVLDAKTGKPIPGAMVRIESKFEKYGESKTGPNGKARIEASLPASGNLSLYHRQGGYCLRGLGIRVETTVYQPGSFDFGENNGWWPLYKDHSPEIEIRLLKK